MKKRRASGQNRICAELRAKLQPRKSVYTPPADQRKKFGRGKKGGKKFEPQEEDLKKESLPHRVRNQSKKESLINSATLTKTISNQFV